MPVTRFEPNQAWRISGATEAVSETPRKQAGHATAETSNGNTSVHAPPYPLKGLKRPRKVIPSVESQRLRTLATRFARESGTARTHPDTSIRGGVYAVCIPCCESRQNRTDAITNASRRPAESLTQCSDRSYRYPVSTPAGTAAQLVETEMKPRSNPNSRTDPAAVANEGPARMLSTTMP